MARISPVQPLDTEEFGRLSPAERLDRQSIGVISHRPEIAATLVQLGAALQGETGTLPKRLTELVRLRIAFWNQCRSCMSVRYAPDAISEELVCSLERPQDAADLTETEKAALRFADLMATDHLAINDAVYAELRETLTEGELVELGLHCAFYVGFGRVTATWALHEHLHERYRDEVAGAGAYTPWGPGALR